MSHSIYAPGAWALASAAAVARDAAKELLLRAGGETERRPDGGRGSSGAGAAGGVGAMGC
eukprot:326936-Pelagomonas_calceolata.AAC.1